MFALKQIIDDPGDFIPVPPEAKHRRTEVIFLVMNTDSKPESFANPAVEKDHGIAQFAGCLTDWLKVDCLSG